MLVILYHEINRERAYDNFPKSRCHFKTKCYYFLLTISESSHFHVTCCKNSVPPSQRSSCQNRKAFKAWSEVSADSQPNEILLAGLTVLHG